MLPKRAAIVVTTIFEPTFLDGYIDNLRRHDRGDVDVIVIIDRKTPPTVARRCAELAREGWRVFCPTLDEQETYLRRFPSMAGRIPYDSDNRRNIGFLLALDRGAEILITIDDDNYCLDDSDFVGEHSAVGGLSGGDETSASDGWLNVCSLLEGSTRDPIFPRGFPYFARRRERRVEARPVAPSPVAINVGLWLSDPDVDAVTRLAQAPVIRRFSGQPLFLAGDSWTPINTQNTAITREAVTAYYYIRMGFALQGLKIDRYGDILSGYFIQKCVKTRGDTIRIGGPIADHRRTPHNLFKDLYHELAGMVLLEDLLPWLIDLELPAGSYREVYSALADAIEGWGASIRGFVWDEGGREFLRETVSHMRAWLEAVSVIG
jgi:hypothetical protein